MQSLSLKFNLKPLFHLTGVHGFIGRKQSAESGNSAKGRFLW
jgi:hypothetical protein